MNACTDCRLALRTDDSPEFWKCGHPRAAYDDQVTGQRKIHYCSTERISGCGEKGSRFEPLRQVPAIARDAARAQAASEYEGRERG